MVRLQRLVKYVGISVLSVCLTLLLLEVGIRIVSPQDLNFWDSSSFRRILNTSPHFVENIPHSRARFLGVPVAINGLGIRGDELTVPKPPKTIRILAVGDSITFGYGMRVEDTYAKVLERRLNERVPGGVRYEVINGGTLGGALGDYLHFLREKAEVIQPDVVLIGLCLNDIVVYSESGSISADGAQRRRQQISWIRGFNQLLLRHSQLYMLCYAHLKSFLLGSGAVDINEVRGMDFVALAPPSEYQKQAWLSSLGMLAQIAAFCRHHGYQLVVVAFPMQMQMSAAQLQFYRDRYHLLLGDALSGDPQRQLHEYAAASGITLVDLLPAYRKHDPQDLYLNNKMIPSDPTHPSIKGNQLAADEIFRMLQQTWR